MRYSKIYSLFLTTCIIACGYSLSACHYKFDHQAEQEDSTKPQHILYVELLQPLIFGKAGLGFSLKNPNQEFLLYGSHIFNSGRIPDILNGNNYVGNSYNTDKESIQGYEIGLQVRFRLKSNIQNRPFAQYIKEPNEKGSYYSGFWIETDHKTGSGIGGSFYSIDSFDIWGVKIGGLLGWSKEFGKAVIDIGAGLGIDNSFAKIKYEMDPNINEKEATISFAYKLGIKLGMKL